MRSGSRGSSAVAPSAALIAILFVLLNASAAHQVEDRGPHPGRNALNLTQRPDNPRLHHSHSLLGARHRIVDHHFRVRQLNVCARRGILQH